MNDTPTILMPVSSSRQLDNLSTLIIPLAQARKARLILLHVERPLYGSTPSSQPVEEWLEEWVQKFRKQGIDTELMYRRGHNIAGAIREAVAEIQPSLLVLSWLRESSSRGGMVYDLQDLLLDVPCNLVVWRGEQQAPSLPRRILIPSAGGPNAEWALSLASDLIHVYDGELTLLSVQPQQAEETSFQQAHEDMRAMLDSYLEAHDPDLSPEKIHLRIQRATSPTTGILAAANSGEYDFLMIGATREGVLNRLIFGEIPDKVARQAQIPVLVIKRPLPRRITLARSLWDRLRSTAPALSEAEKIEAYRSLRRNARADTDFLTMIGLSTTIAALGLLLNSPAVVIGAMLVAPLMSAIVALGLGVVQGDERLLKLALRTTAYGVLLSVGISFLLGVLIPGDHVTHEMQARAYPSLLDLAVALASGAAGAYALCRKDVSTSLSGVAIAVALVPPLATIGLAISQLNWQIAGGATLLFLTNLVAIAAMGSFVFLLLGFQPEMGHSARLRLFARGWWGMLILLVLISSILGWLTYRSACESKLNRSLQQALAQELDKMPGVSLREVTWEKGDQGELQVLVEVESTRTLSHTAARTLQSALTESLHRPIALILQVIPTTRLDPLATNTPLPTATHTATPTPFPSLTPTPSPTATPTFIPTPTPSSSPSPSPTLTPSHTPLSTFTATP